MAYSPKRAKAMASGKVQFCIYDGDGVCVFSHKSFMVALQQAGMLQKANPNINYSMKLEELKED